MKPVLDPLHAFGNKSQWCCQCLKVGGVLWSPRGGWGWMRVIMLMIYIYRRGGSEMEDTADWLHLHDGFVRKFGDRWRWGSWSEKLFLRDGRRRASTWERIAIFCGDGLDIQSIYKTKVRTVMIEEVKTANRVGSKLSSESHHYPFLL